MIMDVVGGSAVLSSDSVLRALELTFRDLSAGSSSSYYAE